jgi:two-component system response regulator PilR (NtrC family)
VRVLLVDDEKIKRTALRDDLVESGYETHAVASADEGMRALRTEHFDVVVTDVRMKGMDGTAFLGQIKEKWPDTEVVMITAYATVDNAVEAMKLGAFDYITKPFESAKLIAVLDNISKMRKLADENAQLKAKLAMATGHGALVGQSPAMQEAFEALQLAISSEVPVLVCGETGTGKERFATAIHECGPRKDKPFIKVSCVALSPQLMESELFGHERGAFTGAVESKPGRFELADTGTLFFDEIDDIPVGVQAKLLRVLEGFPFERVGGIDSISVDVRFIAASKANLQRKVAEGTFREDLYYRVSVFPIWIPPLRERREDIPLLVDHFMSLYSGEAEPPTVDEKVMGILWDYDWPGNVRELQNVVRRILVGIGTRRVVTPRDIPPEMRLRALRGAPEPEEPQSFRDMIEANERNLLAKALDDAGGNQSKAAAALGLKLSTFRDKLAKYDIRTWSGRRQNAKDG